MDLRQFEIWLADLNPQYGTEAGKIRPVLILQSDLLNIAGHNSTIICPITTSVKLNTEPLRILIKKGEANIKVDSQIVMDQMRAIDNRRFRTNVGTLPNNISQKVAMCLKDILDLD